VASAPEGSASEFGRLCHGEAGHERGDRCRSVLMLAILPSWDFVVSPLSLGAASGYPIRAPSGERSQPKRLPSKDTLSLTDLLAGITLPSRSP